MGAQVSASPLGLAADLGSPCYGTGVGGDEGTVTTMQGLRGEENGVQRRWDGSCCLNRPVEDHGSQRACLDFGFRPTWDLLLAVCLCYSKMHMPQSSSIV